MVMRNGQQHPDDGGKPVSNSSPQIKNSKVMVLVVDDDVKILRFIGSSLRLAGYNVCTATCGEEALQLLETKQPQIMVLDLLMPRIDGFEVLKKLRPASKLPVIAVSAHASSAQKALDLGANVFLGKPFRPDELVKRIGALLK
jgi:two-component system, OmpR family, KDP operon response regulator KdpE